MTDLASPNDPTPFTVALLGTGTPSPRLDRFGPSILIEADSHRLLFDCGRAATIRLAQLGIPLSTVQEVFLTHLHSDHINGLSDLWLSGWLPLLLGTVNNSRSAPFKVKGPTGTKDMMR
jgi:ribonuclease Z